MRINSIFIAGKDTVQCMHIIALWVLTVIRFLDKFYYQLFYISLLIFFGYITFVFIIGMLYIIENTDMYISSMLLPYSLMCYILLVVSIFSSKWSSNRSSIKEKLKTYLLIFKSLGIIRYIFFFMLVRMCFINLIGINDGYNMELIVFILLISYMFINFCLLIVNVWRGHALNVYLLFISRYTHLTKVAFSYQNLLLLVVGSNVICVIKYYIFTIYDYSTYLEYITIFFIYFLISIKENYGLCLYSDTELTDTDAPHDSVSESGSTGNGASGGGPNSPQDVVMSDRLEDSGNDKPDNLSSNSGSDIKSNNSSSNSHFVNIADIESTIELNNNDNLFPYKQATDTCSYKWGGPFFHNANAYYKEYLPLGDIGKANPSLRAEDSYYFTTYKSLVPLDNYKSTYNGETKCIELNGKDHILVDSAKKLFLKIKTAKRMTTLKLYDYHLQVWDSESLKIYNYYHKPYFNNIGIMNLLSQGDVGTEKEHTYYAAYNAILSHYFPLNKSFYVDPQSKYTGANINLRDFCVKIFDPKLNYLRNMSGINANVQESMKDQNLFHQVHTIVEIKNPHPKEQEPWLAVLEQLKKYHVSNENTNSFSIAIDGTRVAFFMYIHGIHKNYPNKSPMVSGFLCLQATDEGVSILEQKDTFAPQIVWYDAFNNRHGYAEMDRAAIHMLFTYIKMQYGVPKIDINNINNLSSAPTSIYFKEPQVFAADVDGDRYILAQLNHNGRISKRVLLKDNLIIASDNKDFTCLVHLKNSDRVVTSKILKDVFKANLAKAVDNGPKRVDSKTLSLLSRMVER